MLVENFNPSEDDREEMKEFLREHLKLKLNNFVCGLENYVNAELAY